VLDPAELDVTARYFDIGELGEMHHDPARNVLHLKYALEDLAEDTGRSVDEMKHLLATARRKMVVARSTRPTPFIDRTMYTGWNAMAVTAYLESTRVLR